MSAPAPRGQERSEGAAKLGFPWPWCFGQRAQKTIEGPDHSRGGRVEEAMNVVRASADRSARAGVRHRNALSAVRAARRPYDNGAHELQYFAPPGSSGWCWWATPLLAGLAWRPWWRPGHVGAAALHAARERDEEGRQPAPWVCGQCRHAQRVRLKPGGEPDARDGMTHRWRAPVPLTPTQRGQFGLDGWHPVARDPEFIQRPPAKWTLERFAGRRLRPPPPRSSRPGGPAPGSP